MNTRTLLSNGMGVESMAIFLRWIHEPETRPCPLEDLICVTAQVGDEYRDTKTLVETYMLPLMRKHRIRYVQVARHGHLEADGITVLGDTREPTTLYLDGDYKLSDELKRNGTVPQYSGALKFKAWVIETWMAEHLQGELRHAIGYNADEAGRVEKSEYAFAARVAVGFNADETARVEKGSEYDGPRSANRVAFGYNADETSRIEKNSEYNGFIRLAFYPLMEWGWNRQKCLEYIFEKLGVWWRKSACVYCPFNALRDEAIERHREHPHQVADAMILERLSLALNPRATLYKNKSLIQITEATSNTAALDAYSRRLGETDWAVYRVRRLYQQQAQAYRAVEKHSLHADDRRALAGLKRVARELGSPIEDVRGIPYVYRERRGEDYPTREEFYTIAPAVVEDKARYGIPWFDGLWNQERLFES